MFNEEKAKEFLSERERKERSAQEEERKQLLEKVITLLKAEFKNSPVEVYLVGSVLRPFSFSSRSDIDIVLKNYTGDRFEFWASFENKIGRSIEIISFETCKFQEFVLSEGLKVV